MKLKTVKYNPATDAVAWSKERADFKNNISTQNALYFFYNESECLYIGETETSLIERCFTHENSHQNKPWFKESNTIHIIDFEKEIDGIARQALESIFICILRPKYNKKRGR